jgi:peptidoglycan/LPS O-acetylase OafA/YrhL
MQTFGYTFIATACAGAIAAAVAWPDGLLVRLLQSRPLIFFGRYSYGLYVVHQPILFLVPVPPLAAVLVPHVASHVAADAVAITAVFALCLAVALASWHFLEQPVLKYKRLFHSRPSTPHGSDTGARKIGTRCDDASSSSLSLSSF